MRKTFARTENNDTGVSFTGGSARMMQSALSRILSRDNTARSNVVNLASFRRHVNAEDDQDGAEEFEARFIYPSNNDTSAPASAEFAWLHELQDTKGLISYPDMDTITCISNSELDSSHDEVRDRIDNLRDIAADEGIEISAASEKDLWSFLCTMKFTRRPYITLLDNGNLRAIWKNADREQIGIQFRGRGQVQYVLFSSRLPNRFMAQASGRDTLRNVQRQIDAHDLQRLITA